MKRRLAWTLAIAVTCGMSSAARGQQYQTPTPSPYPGGVAAPTPAFQQVSANMEMAPASDDLAARVAKLENQLKEAKEKEDAAKKKAACQPTAVVGGIFQMDYAGFSQNNLSEKQFDKLQNGIEFRRARIQVAGEGFSIMDYKMEMDFATLVPGTGPTYDKSTADGQPQFNGVGSSGTPLKPNYLEEVAFKDVYIGLHELPVIGNVRMGHFKEPFGLEQLTSDRYLTFMERSMVDEGCLVPGRQLGVMAHDWTENERATWAVGAFRTNVFDPPGFIQQGNQGGWSVTSRVTWLPWYDECTSGELNGTRGLFHVGAATSYRDVGTYLDGNGNAVDAFSIASRPEAHLANKVVSLTLTDVESYQLAGLEAAYVYGPFSLQSEYVGAWLHRTTAADAYINGGYAYMSYFLTGENRSYNKKAGCFDRVKPYENFFRVRDEDGCVQTGLGAWEIGYRYSWVNLNDDTSGAGTGPLKSTAVAGGTAIDHTIGTTWYLNPYMRVMFNYVYSIDSPNFVTSPSTYAVTPNSTGTAATAALANKKSDESTIEMRCQIDF